MIFKPASFRIDPAMAKELARVGIPISFQELMVRISFLYLTAVVNHCGVYAAAVVGIGSKYDVFSMLSATSIANALAAITAQNMGGREAGTSEEIVVVRAEFCPSCRLRLLDLGTGESGDDDCPVFRGQWSDCSGGSIFPGMQL